MPPLRERAGDIPLLAEFFLGMFAKVHNKRYRSVSPGFLGALARHSWPGNVRELQNVIERSVVLANGHDRLGVDDLPPELQGFSLSDELPKGSFHEAVKGFKRELVRSALAMHNGNKLKAAKELGISRCYLHRLLNQLNVAGGAEEEAELQEMELEAEEQRVEAVAMPGSRAATRIA
jgi:transcriptional regulator with PAS, ATPase and Fis domain